MQRLLDVLKSSLAASLSTLTPVDRIAAAWPVVAGSALAAHTAVMDYRAGVLTLAVADEAWRQQVQAAVKLLRGELARVGGLPLTDILVEMTPRHSLATAHTSTT